MWAHLTPSCQRLCTLPGNRVPVMPVSLSLPLRSSLGAWLRSAVSSACRGAGSTGGLPPRSEARAPAGPVARGRTCGPSGGQAAAMPPCGGAASGGRAAAALLAESPRLLPILATRGGPSKKTRGERRAPPEFRRFIQIRCSQDCALAATAQGLSNNNYGSRDSAQAVFGRIRPKLGKCRPKLTEVGQLAAQVGQDSTNTGQLWPTLAACPMLPRVIQTQPNLSKLRQSSRNSLGCFPICLHNWPMFGRIWPKVGQHRTRLVKCCLCLAEVGQTPQLLGQLGQVWSSLGQISRFPP